MRFGYFIVDDSAKTLDEAAILDYLKMVKTKEIKITVTDEYDGVREITIKKDKDENWTADTEEIAPLTSDIAHEYFDNCVEDNGYDVSMIKSLAETYRLPENKIKAIVDFQRNLFIARS